jgi:glycosyl transferase, family 25
VIALSLGGQVGVRATWTRNCIQATLGADYFAGISTGMRAKIHVEDVFDCRVINLARHRQRLKRFFKQNNAVGLPIERFEAIDGSTIDIDQAIASGLVTSRARYSPGAIGVAMSHRAIWRESIERKKCTIVFEDDAVLRGDIREALPPLLSQLADPWDIVLLGYNTDGILDLRLSSGIDLHGYFSVPYLTPPQLSAFVASKEPVGIYKLNGAFGLCGYAISPHGAERLISSCFPMDNGLIPIPAAGRSILSSGLDCVLNIFFRQISAYACFTPLVVPINDRSSSSIQQAQAGAHPTSR